MAVHFLAELVDGLRHVPLDSLHREAGAVGDVRLGHVVQAVGEKDLALLARLGGDRLLRPAEQVHMAAIYSQRFIVFIERAEGRNAVLRMQWSNPTQSTRYPPLPALRLHISTRQCGGRCLAT